MSKQERIQIIGICLIKNEDLYIERVLKNVLFFCDELIILDNMSTDETYPKVERLAKRFSSIKLFRIEDSLLSHKYIESYANTPTWIFGVDGDEIYDPVGLQQIRTELLSGKFLEYWRVDGYFLNCAALDLKRMLAKGYMSPPARLGTKLFNFSLLKSWVEEREERLHGRHAIFKKGAWRGSLTSENRQMYARLYEAYSWETCPLRNLHTCFLPRSSTDSERCVRLNRYEIESGLEELTEYSPYKLKNYKKGDVLTKPVEMFFL